MQIFCFVLIAAFTLVGCATPHPVASHTPSADAQRIAEAIKEALGGMYADWDGPMSIEQIEKISGNQFSEVARDSDEWNAFKAKIQEGDEIYFVMTSDRTWEMLMGRAGYVLVRGSHGVDFYCTVMN